MVELYKVTTRAELALVVGGREALIDLNGDHSLIRSADHIKFDPTGREIISLDLVGQSIEGMGRIPIIHFYKEGVLLESGKMGELHLAALPIRGIPGSNGFIDWIILGDVIK